MIKVSRLPVEPGPAAWNCLIADTHVRPALEQHTTSDWVIIGAGFTGLSAARRLAQLHPGSRIDVIEAGQVATGAAGRNSGFMIDVPHDLSSSHYGGKADKDRREIRLNRAGIDYALDAKAAYGMSDEAIRLVGKINAAITGRGVRHNSHYAQHLEGLAEPYKRLDAQAMRSLTGTNCYVEGLYTPGTAMLQPAMYIRALAEGIEAAGVRIHEQSPVISIKRIGTDWEVHTPNGQSTAPGVILCVNGHLESFGFAKRQLMHIYTYGSMTRALTVDEVARLGGQSSWALTPADPLGTTVRRISGTGGDRIIIRNRATYDPLLQVSEARLDSVSRDHDRSFNARFPMLRGVDMQYRWGGALCMSRNNVPLFGEVDQNLFAACCQNGLGTAKGTIAGKLIAERASNETSPLLDDQCAEAEPLRLPPAPIAALGGTAVLRWGEFRAGKEL